MNVKYHYSKFPPKIDEDKQLTSLICEARTELGKYEGFLSSMENNKVLLSPLFTQEAVLSSRIEGTQSTLTEVLEFEAHEGKQKISEEKKEDIKEIVNYRHAMKRAEKLLEKKPLHQKILLEAHKALMQGVKGKNESPGQYRKIPVWIGPDKTNIKNARFIPIEAQHISDAMSNFEKYIHNNEDYDDLIKIAILHAEFEAIHPFLDGNGRVGRLFIPLYLWYKKLLSSPSFYISTYFEKNKDTYYDLLLNISKKNDWKTWIIFFAQGIVEQSKDNFTRAKKIVDFYKELKSKIPTMSKSPYGITALDFIFQNTYFNTASFYQESGVPKAIAKRLLSTFEKEDLLLCIKGQGRTPNFYVFKKLIDIADGK